jgi:Zn-dependent M16 (insulinase) family peptidase
MLNENHYKMFRMRYGFEGKTISYNEIGEHFGITGTVVRQHVAKVMMVIEGLMTKKSQDDDERMRRVREDKIAQLTEDLSLIDKSIEKILKKKEKTKSMIERMKNAR